MAWLPRTLACAILRRVHAWSGEACQRLASAAPPGAARPPALPGGDDPAGLGGPPAHWLATVGRQAPWFLEQLATAGRLPGQAAGLARPHAVARAPSPRGQPGAAPRPPAAHWPPASPAPAPTNAPTNAPADPAAHRPRPGSAPDRRDPPACAAGILPLPGLLQPRGIGQDAAQGHRDQRGAAQLQRAAGDGGARLIQPLATAAAAAVPAAARPWVDRARADADGHGARGAGRSADPAQGAASPGAPLVPSADPLGPPARVLVDGTAPPCAQVSRHTGTRDLGRPRQAGTQARPADGRPPSTSAPAAAAAVPAATAAAAANPAADAAIIERPLPPPWTTQAGSWPRPAAAGRPEAQTSAELAREARELRAPHAQGGSWPSLPDEERSSGHAHPGGAGPPAGAPRPAGAERWPELPGAPGGDQDDARAPAGAEQHQAQRRRLDGEQRGQPWNA